MSLQDDIPEALTPSEKVIEDSEAPDNLAEATTASLDDDDLGGNATQADADPKVKTKINK